MRRQVIWSDSAKNDYLEILRYVASDNPDAAGRIADQIDRIANSLAEMATGRPGRVTGTYEKVVPRLPYIIAYEVVSRPEAGEVIAILHVIHGARDWPDEEWPRP